MKKFLGPIVTGLALTATAVVPAAISGPVKLDSGRGTRDKSSGRATILSDAVEAEATPDVARLAMDDSRFAKPLSAKSTVDECSR